ncbi:bifunctional hydroxymethylpyrimidine kinase/phosphomethylpyrimidine kinase [Bowdeniella nasicola]|uniref:pyridoxal kinase n=1 Tax=Bowdeniella nasicola TaxID=208480 RepID=A0A1Q5Q1H4_9ACTO|nr:bifunctional hydroxymethylpyrimidine kinase/phosphomethylpyrimidine kinase [Bowdeniella nasicola]OKL53691.1 bifunctional hydroxymethylpyrimidine kinase/phosphomethylpyrimidine kinase [Bowdeniella nasicola]
MVAIAHVIAGSEATGGAGIQVDLKTFHQRGVYGMGTLTCIVSMDPNDNWNHRFVPVDPQVIADQIESATHAFPEVDTLKIGMLGTPETIDVVAKALTEHSYRQIVLDPVLICKTQEVSPALAVDTALREKIVPHVTVITPNVFEATVLSGRESIENLGDLIDAAKKVHELGPKYVVAKGGVELPGDNAVDILFDGTDVTVYEVPKIGDGARIHGAGCTLAAAITAELAKGTEVKEAVRIAKELVTEGIQQRLATATPFTTVWQGAYQG